MSRTPGILSAHNVTWNCSSAGKMLASDWSITTGMSAIGVRRRRNIRYVTSVPRKNIDGAEVNVQMTGGSVPNVCVISESR